MLGFVYGQVYLITCLVNDKKYVGQTTVSLKKRFSNHLTKAKIYDETTSKGRDTPLFKAIRKYGKASFKITRICVCSSQNELDLMEDLYMILLEGCSKTTGYNIRRGGANGRMSEEVKKTCGYPAGTFRHTPESRLKMSVSMKKSIQENPRPAVSEQTKKKIRLAQKNRKPMLEQTKQKMRERFSGEKGTNYCFQVCTKDLVCFYKLEYSCEEIATLYPMTGAGVRKRLQKAGVVMRSCASKSPRTPISLSLLKSTT